jgi:hypothetical protein
VCDLVGKIKISLYLQILRHVLYFLYISKTSDCEFSTEVLLDTIAFACFMDKDFANNLKKNQNLVLKKMWDRWKN